MLQSCHVTAMLQQCYKVALGQHVYSFATLFVIQFFTYASRKAADRDSMADLTERGDHTHDGVV